MADRLGCFADSGVEELGAGVELLDAALFV
jgi:hypothetical protein